MPVNLTFTAGPDRYAANSPDIYELYFVGGDDWLAVRAGAVTAWMGSGADYAWLGGGGGSVYGQTGDDQFDVRSSGWLVNGGSEDDLFRIFAGNDHDLIGASGDDRFFFYGASSGVHLSGGDGNDLFAGRGHEVSGVIYGGAGNDRFVNFDHHAGQNLILRGGAGNDVYRLEYNLTVIVDEQADEGVDTILIAGGLDYSLGANVENLIALESLAANAPAILNGNELNNRIQGSIGFDSISGGAGNDYLDGWAGNDTIWGEDGDDRIVGGLGIDFMGGGAGADRYIFRSTDETPYDPFYTDTDWIFQWDSGDRVDVSAIDADTTTEGFQHFNVVQGEGSAIGTLYFSADPGGWGWWIVEGHTDGDGIPDFSLLISDENNVGYPPVTVDSFIV